MNSLAGGGRFSHLRVTAWGGNRPSIMQTWMEPWMESWIRQTGEDDQLEPEAAPGLSVCLWSRGEGVYIRRATEEVVSQSTVIEWTEKAIAGAKRNLRRIGNSYIRGDINS